MTVSRRIYYSGRVQGVGFRYTAVQLADGFAVAGHVRNMANGEVELFVEGELDQVDGFISAVASRMADYIERTTVENTAPEGCQEFRVRY